ncbi:C2 domain-containing protein [Aphelenchoides avenae]|nr:C2 domain-containing protein [Aphelenchus avenae]
MVACWCVGNFNFSFLWICLFTGLYILKTYMWVQREQRRMRARALILRERESIMAQFAKLEDLPAWVQFPDTERIEWVNKVLQQLWPYIGEYSKLFMREFIEPQVRAQMPSPFKSFKFLNIDMGDLPCRVGGLKVYTHNVGRDKIIVDMQVVYAGDAEFTVQACGFTGGMNQIVLSGQVRCVLQPLLPYPPMIGGISGSFIELPKFDFNLTGMGEFVQLPGLISAIRSVINAQVANLCVLPNKIVVPLAPDVDVTKLYFPEPDGVIRLKIVEARNLENKDVSMLLRKDRSDPYCEVRVGSQLYRTRTIDNDLNPVFNEYFEAVVDQASGQKLRIELFDEDRASADEELGRLTVPLESVRQAGVIDRWFHLEACKHGELHIKLAWFNLSSDEKYLTQQSWEAEWQSADKPVHPAMLMVFVDNVSELPYPKANLEPSPFVEVKLGRVAQRTPVQLKTVNPLYQSKFIFFVKQPEGQELKLTAIDDGTRRTLGELSIPLLSVMKEPKMEMFQQTFLLTHGIHSSPIVVTVSLRTFVQPENVQLLEEPLDNIDIYANASHIERAATRSASDINGSLVTAAEPGKTAERNRAGTVPETKLNTNNYQTINRSSPSLGNSSNTSLFRHEHKFVDRLRGRKHSRRSRKQDDTAGEIQLGVRYDDEHFKLIVNIVCAKDLSPVDKNGEADPYVSVKLIPVNGATSKVIKRKTAIVQKSLNPYFDSQFDFDVVYSNLLNHKLQIAVKDALNYGMLAKAPTLGTIELPLDKFDRDKPLVNQWIELRHPH